MENEHAEMKAHIRGYMGNIADKIVTDPNLIGPEQKLKIISQGENKDYICVVKMIATLKSKK